MVVAGEKLVRYDRVGVWCCHVVVVVVVVVVSLPYCGVVWYMVIHFAHTPQPYIHRIWSQLRVANPLFSCILKSAARLISKISISYQILYNQLVSSILI